VSGIAVSALGQMARRRLAIPDTLEDAVLVVQVSDAAQQAGVPVSSAPVVGRALRPLAVGADMVVASTASRSERRVSCSDHHGSSRSPHGSKPCSGIPSDDGNLTSPIVSMLRLGLRLSLG